MQRILASDFFEIGRSGHIYFRQDVLAMERREIKAELSELEIRRLDEHTLLVTYLSTEEFDGRTENSRRSSIWSQTSDGWQLRFHQGTPYRP